MSVDFPSFIKKYCRPPKHQFPTGTCVYKGFQGSGKTLSMVHDTFALAAQFPKAVIFGNLNINGLRNYHRIETDDDLEFALSYCNGKDGVLILLDEAQLFFNKKTGISLDVLTAICQQRKDRRRLIFTSQIWEDLDVSLRKQVKEVISCHCYFHRFQINSVSDGETISWDNLKSTWTANHLRTDIFKHNQELYNSYDTFQKIVRNSSYSRSFTPTPATSSITIHNK